MRWISLFHILPERPGCESRIFTALRILVVGALLSTGRPAQAHNSNEVTRDYVAVTTFSSSYASANLGTNPSSANGNALMPSVDMEFALRFNTIFNLTLSWTRFQDPDPNDTTFLQDEAGGFGAGLKIDLPGFFFLGSRADDNTRRAKNYAFNTYLFGEVVKLTLTDMKTGSKITATGGRDGIGMDIFPWNQTAYLSTRVAFFNLLGVSYINYAWGFGMRF